MAARALEAVAPAAARTERLLEVSELSVTFGNAKAVDKLCYSLNRGETLGVVGESGCGKTQAALALLGLTPGFAQRSGQVIFEEQNLLALTEAELEHIRGAQISMIFQEPMTALNPVLSIGEQVAEMFILHQDCNRRQALELATEALARVHIADCERCLSDYPHQLSGGMRQRVMIAMALACRPKLLIADEPTTALDVTVQAQILDLILEMQDELGMSVLFISHNLGVISQIADRVMVMYAGQAVEITDADTLLHEPCHPYTQALLETLPKLGGQRGPLPTIPGTVPPLGVAIPGCKFALRCAYADQNCHHHEPSLDELIPQHQVACFKADSLALQAKS